MDELKILIADNSSVYKKMFTQAVTEVNKNASVTCVADGDETIRLIKRGNYNIVIIDAEFPGLGLIELLKAIMLEIPKAFILVTARPSAANEKLFPEALLIGAAECMIKPIYDSYAENLEIIKRKMKDIIKILCDGCRGNGNAESVKAKGTVRKNKFRPEILLIAASTGGPLALETIITKLRGDFPVPVLIVQHIPAHFTENLAQNLSLKSQLKVKVAENRETVSAGTVYFAPGGTHMTLDAKNRINFDDSPPLNGVKPAADVLFESIAERSAGVRALAVILTGMGSDGKDGLIKLKEKKECFCLAQSEKTCVVYGMPRAVVEEGLADKVLDLEKIAAEIESFNY